MCQGKLCPKTLNLKLETGGTASLKVNQTKLPNTFFFFLDNAKDIKCKN